MFWRLVVSMVGGFATHQMDRPITDRFDGSTWGLMIRYAAGSLALIPFQILVISKLKENGKRRSDDDILAGNLLTLGAFGTGVLIGYLVEGE